MGQPDVLALNLLRSIRTLRQRHYQRHFRYPGFLIVPAIYRETFPDQIFGMQVVSGYCFAVGHRDSE